MKFRHPDVIRHKLGTSLFEVVAASKEDGVYVLREHGKYQLQMLAENMVDLMFVKMFPLDESACSAVLDTPKVRAMEAAAVRNCPTVTSPASDVTVSLPGLPAGYYLKAFRKASSGDLVLNTSGAVVPAKITQNGMTLYRPIVGKVFSLNAPTPLIPGVPEGWTVIAYRKPKTGEQCFRLGSTEVFTCGENDWAEKRCYVIVQKIPRIPPCDGTLPGIPKEYKLVGFGAVKEDQFFIDTVGTLKPGPARNRLVLDPLQVKQPEVVTEYELEVGGVSFWISSPAPKYPGGRTGRTRKVVVQ